MSSYFKNSKKAHEFIGLCLGVLADNRLVTKEIEFLRDWLRRHPRVAGSYPAKGLFIRICEMLEDSTIDEEEEKELFNHLYELTGSQKSKTTKSSLKTLEGKVAKPAFTDPSPKIVFEGKSFFLYGRFIIGTEEWLGNLVAERGGNLLPELTAEADFCIIGAMAELDTDLTPELCSNLNDFSKKNGLKIVSEENWVNHLFS